MTGPVSRSFETRPASGPGTPHRPPPGGAEDACPAAGAGTVGPAIRSAALQGLMRSFRERGLAVVAWKLDPGSSDPLPRGGDTDLLAPAGRHREAVEALEACGFRCIPASWWRSQPHVSDWFQAGDGGGGPVHVQLYEKLVLGSAFDAQVEVPGAEALFERMTGGTPGAVFAADAAVLALCRAALARPWSPGRGARALREDAERLAGGATRAELEESAASLFPGATAAAILEGFSGAAPGRLRRRLLAGHRSLPRAGGEPLGARLLAAAALCNRKTARLPLLARRRLRRPAPVVAVIGSDGSGKSTVARRLAEALGGKLDTRFCYFGTGDGPAAWHRWPLLLLKALRERMRGRGGARPGGAGAPRRESREEIPGLARALWAVSVALERRSKMRRVRRAAAAGWIVVTDRYPQRELPGIHDGPRLDDWTERGGVRGLLARWEGRIYRRLADSPPDLVLFLEVSPETAAARRPEEDAAELQRRIAAAAQLRFGGCPRRAIDADGPLAEVLAEAHEEIFRHL